MGGSHDPSLLLIAAVWEPTRKRGREGEGKKGAAWSSYICCDRVGDIGLWTKGSPANQNRSSPLALG